MNSWGMEFMQVYAANLSTVQQNTQKNDARIVCAEVLWHLKRKIIPRQHLLAFSTRTRYFAMPLTCQQINIFFSQPNPSRSVLIFFQQ